MGRSTSNNGGRARLEVVSAMPQHFTKDNFQHIKVLTQGELEKRTDILVVENSLKGPPELFVLPEILTVIAGETFNITVSCSNTPWFLLQGVWIAQAIILPEDFQRHRRTAIYWTEVVGADRPTLHCKLTDGKATAHLCGMVDTRADVTIISESKWPPQWGPKPTRETITGIRGSASSMRSSALLVIKGPDGHMASIKPLVVPSGFTLWGQDVLLQWGTRLEMPSPAPGF